jgi:hypothetical protein
VCNSSVEYKAANILGCHFTCTDTENVCTGISVQKVIVYIDLTFQHLHKIFLLPCHLSGSKCDILCSGRFMICGGPFAEVLAECQLLFYTVFNVLTYRSRSPSSDNNAGSRENWRIL